MDPETPRLTQFLLRLLLIFLGKLIGPKHQHGWIGVLNTSDPCVLDDDAVFLLVVDGTELDTRGAFHDIGPLPKDVDAKDVVTRDALETNGTLLLHK